MSKTVAGHADVTQFRALAGKSSTLPAKLKTQLRKEFRTIGGRVVADVQRTVRMPPQGTAAKTGHGTGLREDIAQGVKVTIATGNRAGIVITSSTNDQAHPRGLVIAYGKPKGWRHPIFGTATWVHQQGRPYFAPVVKSHRGEVLIGVRRAMVTAAEQALK